MAGRSNHARLHDSVEAVELLTNTISVVTPVIPTGARYLRDAYESLRSQELPEGWTWQWLVQQDGLTGAVGEQLPVDPRISFGCSRHGGPGIARTVALQRATGSLIKALDADDQLTDGALARDIAVLESLPTVGWTVSKALDLLPDGSTVGWDNDDPAEGVLPGSDVFDFWVEHEYRLPVLPGTICIRRDLLLALGGWMALPASEDTGMLMAAGVIGLLYRKWPEQATAQPAHVDPVERNGRMALIRARVGAMRSTRSFLRSDSRDQLGSGKS
jgi:glycosyltransferase involved in cell wall biosynthesis